MIKKVSDLDVFKISHAFAMEIFTVTRNFPKEERYSLTDQVVRSSRSVPANIAEGWGKRIYENEFKKHLIYAMGFGRNKNLASLFPGLRIYLCCNL